ncbi:MAG: WG repeat-containing protein, partial [Prevotellaceae bacterium]|nr:WG repeat-containing protein [Prevotellaceae bacterium]
MKKVFQILSVAVIVLTAAGCGGGSVQITYSAEPLAAVLLNGKWGFIDTKDNEAVPCKYDEVNEFSEGLAAVELDGRWFYIDKTGKVILKLDKKYDRMQEFSEGLASVKKYDYKVGGCGFIDKTGKEVIPLNNKYDAARAFHDGRAAVESDKKWGFIDTTGTEVIPCQYLEVTDFVNGRTFVKTKKDSRDQFGNRYQYNDTEVLDINGAIAEEKKWHTETLYVTERSNVETGIQYAVVGKDGVATPYKYTNTRGFSDGMVAVAEYHDDGLNGGYYTLWGFVNEDPRETVPCKYIRVSDFSNGYAAVQLPEKYRPDDYYSKYNNKVETRGGKWGLIDKTGKTIIPFKYESDYRDGQTVIRYIDEQKFHFMHFSDDMALVLRDGKYGYCDKSGNEVIPCKYDFGLDFSGDFARVNNNDKYGIIDKTGREIVPCEYKSDDLGYFSNG